MESSFKFTWTIEDFSKLTCKHLHSNTFYTATHQGVIVIYPKAVNNGEAMSMSLFFRPTETTPPGTTICSYAKLSLINQINDEMSITYEHNFNERGGTHHFIPFISSHRFHDSSTGFLVNDTCKITVEFSSVEDSWQQEVLKIQGMILLEAAERLNDDDLPSM